MRSRSGTSSLVNRSMRGPVREFPFGTSMQAEPWRYRPSTPLCRATVICGSSSTIHVFACGPTARSEIVVIEDAGVAALVDVLAQQLLAVLELDGQRMVELGVELVQRDDVDHALVARDVDRVVLDL